MSHQNHQANIFYQEKQETSVYDNCSGNLPELESINYLKRGDSNKYIEQFLIKQDPAILDLPSKNSEEKDQNYEEQEDEEFQLDEGAEFTPSSFHNFQKHLTICLKKSIEINVSQSSENYQRVGGRMWKVFRSSTVCTKKILHYLLGDENEHKVNDQGLKQFGLKKIFDENTHQVTKSARKYLAAETLHQIQCGKLKNFIETKKMKEKERFKRYINLFVQQLRSGYLRKRLSKEKVAQLSK